MDNPQETPAIELIISKPETTLAVLEDAPKIKKSSLNTYEDCLKIYRKMFWFNWDLKELSNSRHSPSKYSFFLSLNLALWLHPLVNLTFHRLSARIWLRGLLF
jgi:hypothetical protein